ncbi:helix-turn-helix transcriptional regulator [Streptococcus agalactiae]|uniref:helix-turn-helix transcriptional regulator n=1 Tax=Streptococcus agalactiae TaxID=1311 RepID=UPI00397D706B
MTKMTLKALRATKNWSQEEVARALKVSKDTWGNWERGNTEPSVTKAYQIAYIFDISLDDIIFLPNIAV